MGSAASNTRGSSTNVIHQLPTQDPLRNNSLHHHPRDKSSTPPPKGERRTRTKPRVEESEWPLPPTEFKDDFVPAWTQDRERYSIKRAYHAVASVHAKKIKLFDEAIKNKDFHQKETGTNQWKVENSSIHDSAHVQSSLRTESHRCINLSTTQEIETLLNALTNVHEQISVNVEERGKLISQQTKQLVDLLINDTRGIQQTLLAYAKKRQTLQDELYNEWLQKYIVELDKWKSAQLAELQDELQKHQRAIMMRSQILISQVNQEANDLREELLRTEQANAQYIIAEITEKIQTMATHQLGTETMTRINLVIHGNVGTKAPGQEFPFDFEQNNKK